AVEVRADHVEEVPDGLEAVAPEERLVAGLPFPGPRPEDPGPVGRIGFRERTVTPQALGEEGGADPAAAEGRINLAVIAMLAEAVGGVDRLAVRRADDEPVDLGDGDVAS